RAEIYVQPFPPTGSQFQITRSAIGSVRPLWSPDGKQIFYMQAEGGEARVYAVDVQTQPTVGSGQPVLLPIKGIVGLLPSQGRNYDISADGKHFIVPLSPDQVQSGDRPSLRINTVVNWFSELKNHVPVK